MRMNTTLGGPRGVRIALWTLATLMLCGLAPVAVAGDLLRTMSSVWVPATVLGLTLITMVSGSQR